MCHFSVFLSVDEWPITQSIQTVRGIHQGDSISPYLFLICSDGLSYLLRAIGPVHLSRGVRVGIHTPWVSQLLFVTASFFRSLAEGADRLQEILNTYSRCSGQLVNKDKFAVFFSSNCTVDVKHEVRSVLQIDTEALVEKYLGLPTALGRVTKDAFEYMPNRLRSLMGTEWP